MLESIKPKGTTRLSRIEGWIKLGIAFCALVGTIWGGTIAIIGAVGSVATDKELAMHDQAKEAHIPLQEELDKCLASSLAMGARIEEGHDDTIALTRRMVRLIAADRESKHPLKAAAATFYEEEFRRLTRKGLRVEEAMLEALRTPWYDRPRGM
jgi:hypothetical protein